MFNVGAKVICIQTVGTAITDGKVYTVKSVNDVYVYLKETHGGWYHTRFELVDDGRTSRTTDPITSKGKRKVNKYEQAVLDTLRSGAESGVPEGFTGKDIANFTEHPLNCITPRFAPLRRKGLIKALEVPIEWGENRIVPKYVKRDKQIVWVLA